MTSRTITLPGINIQAPWAQAIVEAHKGIETRTYPLPAKWHGKPLVIILVSRKFSRYGGKCFAP